MAIMVTRGRGRDESSHGGNVQVMYVPLVHEEGDDRPAGRPTSAKMAGSAQIGFGSLFFFLLFSFLFCFSFIIFDLGLQIKSNKFVKFYKIPNIQNRHLGTIFGQIVFTKLPFWSNLHYMAIWEFSKLGFINIPKLFILNQYPKVENTI